MSIKANYVINLFCFILLVYSLYIFTEKYLKYNTVTTVGIVRERNKFPEMETPLCYLPDGKRNIFDGKLSLNGHQVAVSPIGIRIRNIICHSTTFKNSIKDTDNEIFRLETRSSNRIFILVKDLKRRFRHTFPNMNPKFLRDINIDQALQLYITKLLPAPYDTNCASYPISGLISFSECLDDINQYTIRKNITRITEELVRATKLCLDEWLQDCEQILFERTILPSPDPQSLIAIYRSLPISFTVNVSIAITLFIQQIIGLVSTFLEVAILDTKRFATESALMIINRLEKLVKRFFLRMLVLKLRQFIEFSVPKLVFLLVLTGCAYELYKAIDQYMEFEVDTETFYGKPLSQYIPSITVCFESDNVMIGNTGKNSTLLSIIFMTNEQPTNISKSTNKESECYMAFPDALESSNRDFTNIADISFNVDISISVFASFSHVSAKKNFVFSAKENKIWKLATSIIEQYNLPSPYKSSCRQYQHLKEACAVDCNHTLCHERYFLSLGQRDAIPSRMKVIQLIRSNELLSIKMIPKQPISEFLTYTASLTSLWMGLTFISLVRPVFKVFDMMKKTSKSLMKLILYSLLLVLLLVHSYILLDNYLQYPTITVVNMMGEETIHLPSVSIVFRMNNRTARNGLVSYRNESLNHMSPSAIDGHFKKIPNIVESLYIAWTNKTGEDKFTSNDISSYITPYIYKDTKVITFELGIISRDRYVYKRQQASSSRYLFRIDFSEALKLANEREKNIPHDESSIASVILHDSQYVDVETKIVHGNYSEKWIKYLSSELRLLKYPYGTNCIDYIMPLQTNNSVINCIIRLHRQKYGKIPYDLTLPIYYTDSRMKANKDIISACGTRFSKEPHCKSIDYSITLYNRFNVHMKGDIHVSPHTRQTVCEYVPKMSILYLTLLIAESFDIWLGISLYLILKESYNLFHFCYTKHSQTVSQHEWYQ